MLQTAITILNESISILSWSCIQYMDNLQRIHIHGCGKIDLLPLPPMISVSESSGSLLKSGIVISREENDDAESSVVILRETRFEFLATLVALHFTPVSE